MHVLNNVEERITKQGDIEKQFLTNTKMYFGHEVINE